MDINKKSRTELKAYFVKNAIPTETNFRDLVDAGINQKDDGLTKSAGSPLSVEAASTGERPILHFYDNFASAQAPSWVMSLLPGVTSGQQTTGSGLSVGDGAGAAKARLFIETATGNVGIGVTDPAGYKLNVGGSLNVSGPLNITGSATVSGAATVDSLTFTAPVSDLPPVLTARTVPVNQGNANQSTELIIFHGNDGDNGAGPDYITLRAPGLRFQTYNDSSVQDINNPSGANTRLYVAPNGTTTVYGTLNANAGLTVAGNVLNANAGLTVAANQNLTANGPVALNAGATVSGSVLNANAGLTVAGNQNLTANGPILANAGLTVSNATLNARAGLSVSGSLTATSGATISGGTLSATGGAAISGGLLTATSGATISGGLLTATAGATISGGVLNATAGATVTGIANVGTLTFPAPVGDPQPVITTRTIPAGQGQSNESTELILYHGNDPTGGSGPDYITLRAPAIRLQTYNDANVNNIDNNSGSNSRVVIDPDGKTTFSNVTFGPANDYAHAQYTLSGGGYVTWTNGRLKWTNRFIAISMERGVSTSIGFIDILPSSASLSVVQDWDGAARSSTADGVVMNGWEALWAVHAIGGNNVAVSLRITAYNQSTPFKVPSNWILIAVYNADDNTMKLGTGQVLSANQTLFKGGLVPSGTIVMYGRSLIPDGWWLCDGTNGTPDLRNRFIVAAGGAYGLGATGGTDSVTLTVDQMPNHYHEALGGGTDDGNFTGGNMFNGERIPWTRSDGNSAGVERTRATGGSQAHENRPPYYALYFIMKL